MKMRFWALAFVLASGATFAQADTNSGFYAGSGAGFYYVDFDDIDFDETAGSLRIFGGYQLNEYLSFEAGYSKWFETSTDVLTADVELDGTAYDVSVRPTMPLGERFEAYGILGWTQYDFEIKISDQGFSVSDADSDDSMLYGLGGAFNVTDHWQLRSEWVAVDVEDANFGMVSVSATYNFR